MSTGTRCKCRKRAYRVLRVGGLNRVETLLEGLVAGHLALTLVELLEIVLLTLMALLQIVLLGFELHNAGVELLDLLLEVVGQKAGNVDTTRDSGDECLRNSCSEDATHLLGLLVLLLGAALLLGRGEVAEFLSGVATGDDRVVLASSGTGGGSGEGTGHHLLALQAFFVLLALVLLLALLALLL